jgi:lipopolysaccharide heptosyltransferase II
MVVNPPAVIRLPEPARRRWQAVRNLLVVRLDHLGDVLMTTPALAAIRHALPQARITLLASGSGAATVPHLPVVDSAIVFDAPWMQPVAAGEGVLVLPGQAERQMVERLAALHFDAAIIFTVCTQSALPAALLCRMAGIPLRLAHSRENPYGLLSDWIPDHDVLGPGLRHEVERQLALVAAAGWQPPDERLLFRVDARDAERARQRLAQACLRAGLAQELPAPRYFVVHCGATAPSRRYPARQFGAAAELVAERSGALAVFTGSPDESDLIAQARHAMAQPSVSLAGRLGLGELAGLIAGAGVLVGNNTGPVHIAAAVGTPVVDLYALTNPQHTPWRVHARVLNRDVPCRNCLKSRCPQGHQACLRGVTPQEVAAAALELMREPAAAAEAATLMTPPRLDAAAPAARFAA